MPRVTLRGIAIHYQQIGRGPDLVLIHGLYCNLAFWWLLLAPRFAETHRVTALDLRGHGFSAMPPLGYRAADLAGDVVALMEHLGIVRAHILGHSFGGAVALAIATQYPERIEHLTLADAWVPSLQAWPVSREPGAWPALRERLLARGIAVEGEPPRVVRGFYEELLDTDGGSADPRPRGEELLAFAQMGGVGTRLSRTARRWRQLMADTSAHREFGDPFALEAGRLHAVSGPVALVYGARSRYLQTRDGLEKLLPGQRSVTVPDAGHYFPLVRPGVLIDAVATDAWGAKSTPGGSTRAA